MTRRPRDDCCSAEVHEKPSTNRKEDGMKTTDQTHRPRDDCCGR